MNRPIIVLTVIILGLGLNCPANAQWDLNGMPVNINNSGGQGQVSGNQLRGAGGSPIQPYNESRGIQPGQSQYQTIYNQPGFIFDTNPNSRTPNVATPYVNPYQGGGGALPASSMLPLALRQTTLPKNLSRVRFNPSTGALPPTTLDSFVHNAGGAASRIYGDEGTGIFGPPPDNGFPESSTINAGIVGSNNKTLTTGHGSKMPSASGNGMTKSGAR